MTDIPPYDVYFCFPVKKLEAHTLALTPYIPFIHAEPFFEQCQLHPEMFTYMPFPPFPTIQDLHDWVENKVRQDPAIVLFAMINKQPIGVTDPLGGVVAGAASGAFAGIVGLTGTSPANHSTEIGLLFTFPKFQRTHVTKTSIALLLAWCFEDLGMKRVQYRSLAQNFASVKVAEKMGFRQEGTRRWDRLTAPGTVSALYTRDADLKSECGGLHVTYLSLCEDDWEEGARHKTYELLHHPAIPTIERK